MSKTIPALVYRFFSILVPLICLFSSLLITDISASSINLFLQPAKRSIQKRVKTRLIKEKLLKLDTKSPAQIGKKIVKSNFKNFLPHVSGFIALYGGYIDYSDRDGSLIFPLLHKEEKLYLVITPKIDLYTIEGNTISHKLLLKDEPAQIFLFEKKEDKNRTNKTNAKEPTYYWQVKEVERPQDNTIDALSIVILTKPKNIVVPTGDFLTSSNPNIILPKIYVVGNMDHHAITSDFLNIRRFFEQIERQEKSDKEKVSQKMIKNF